MSAEQHASSLAAEAHRRRQQGSHVSLHLRDAREPVFIAGGTTVASRCGQNSLIASLTSAAASRAGQNSLAASLAGAATGDEGVGARQGATDTSDTVAFPDSSLFNQAVKKLDEAVNHLPTVAVVKF
ncbi:MAG: hypothetical protein ABR964_00415 [Tepidisphaeraceae bacterium]|jgi:hypothetical protein